MKKFVTFFLTIVIIISFVGCNYKHFLADDEVESSTIGTNDSTESIITLEGTTAITEETIILTEETTELQSNQEDYPYDKDGTLYIDILQYYLSDFGYVYWDVNKEYYVLKPRDTYRQVILGLVEYPFNETYLEYWDLVTEMIQMLTEQFPCAVCVANPANPNAYLLIVVIGEVGYTAF